MRTETLSETGWRGSREGWLEAGYQALIESGVDAVKIQPLAKRLNLSRTSFYWFFQDREALLYALCQGWGQRTTVPLLAATREYAETLTEAMLNVLACFLSDAFDSRLEFALRSWALQDDKVARSVEAADADRLAALRDMLTRWGIAPDRADVRARTIYLTQIGYISMRAQENMSTRLERIPNYVEIYTGLQAEPRELARFTARLTGS
jgi:AcrR family transcriptional regulator